MWAALREVITKRPSLGLGLTTDLHLRNVPVSPGVEVQRSGDNNGEALL